MEVIGVSAGGGGTIEMVASGSLSNGQTVIVSNDGKAVGVATITENLGALSSFSYTGAGRVSSVFDPTTNQVIVSYSQSGGKVNVGTISGETVSYGATATFTSNATNWNAVTYDTNSNRVVVAYRDDNDGNKGKAVVGTVTGTAVTFGTPVQFESGNSQYIAITFDSNENKVVISYQDYPDSSRGKFIVGNVSGDTISFGSATIFNDATTQYIASTFDSTNNKVVTFYSTGSGSYATVATVSGTSITQNTIADMDASESQFYNGTPAIYDSSIDKILVVYTDTGDSNKGKIRAGSISGSTLTFGSETTFSNEGMNYPSVAYNSTDSKINVIWRSSQAPSYTFYNHHAVGTISGTTVSMGDTSTTFGYSSSAASATYDPINNRTLFAVARDVNPTFRGDSKVFRNEGFNLTSTNFIGFSDAAYTDGQTAKIQIEGSVDDAQTGLTTAKVHYVQTDGTLSTTAGTPSVSAGIAITDTKIIVKG